MTPFNYCIVGAESANVNQDIKYNNPEFFEPQRGEMMDNLKAAEILSEIGGMVAREAGPDPDGAFLYAEAEDGVVRPMLSKDLGSVVQDLDVSSALAMRILDLWNAADNDKKWVALLLTVQGVQFDARFQYPEEWGDEDEFERRARILLAKYGDKEIRYPPFEDGNRLTS